MLEKKYPAKLILLNYRDEGSESLESLGGPKREEEDVTLLFRSSVQTLMMLNRSIIPTHPECLISVPGVPH